MVDRPAQRSTAATSVAQLSTMRVAAVIKIQGLYHEPDYRRQSIAPADDAQPGEASALPYNAAYWDRYYGEPYEQSFHWGFPFDEILQVCWRPRFDGPPASFADIGCGPGQTLNHVQKVLPGCQLYGVECQPIPADRVVSDRIIGANFLDVADRLEPVDLAWISCSMYVTWDRQAEFLEAVSRLAIKALVFMNLYLEDRHGIPDDCLRRTIYRDRRGFAALMKGLGFEQPVGGYDFFTRFNIERMTTSGKNRATKTSSKASLAASMKSS